MATLPVIALFIVSGKPGWTDDPCIISNFYGRSIWTKSKSKFKQNQFKPQQIHDAANKTVAEQADAERAASQLHNNNDNIVRRMEKWRKIIISTSKYREERQEGKDFVKRIKQW